MERNYMPPANGGGRRTYEGRTRQIKLPDDVHKWITSHGGGRYLTEIIRAIIAVTPDPEQEKEEE